MSPASQALPRPKKIVGYASELSVTAGDHIGFHVSSELPGEYTATVHRILGGGFDPRAPQLATQPVAELGRFAVLEQTTPLGSRAEACWPDPIDLTAGTFVIGVAPWLLDRIQTIAIFRGMGSLSLEISDSGRLRVVHCGSVVAEAAQALTLKAWTRVVVSWSDLSVTLAFDDGDVWRATDGVLSSAPGGSAPGGSAPAPVEALTLAARPCGAGWDQHFSGRLERPILLPERYDPQTAVERAGEPGAAVPANAVAGWDFASDITAWSVPGGGMHPVALNLHQAPVRGVRGSRWTDGTDYRLSPEQFTGIHFLEDSLEDCEWIAQAEWTVADGTQSGFYALHTTHESGDDDWIPFFVRQAAGAPTAELLVVASSATYFAYANSRFWWEDPIQEIAQDRLVELGSEEQYLVTHAELGLSNYDRHLDASPVVFSSRHRPNLFMRPGHSRAESYASDLYLIAWLERAGIAYDVITDEDLHFGGYELIAPYRAIISGSHPEYLSIAMFDATRAWVEAGGRYFYLGGNGFTSCVTWRSDKPWLMENRTTGDMQNDEETTRTESVNQLDGQLGRAMRDSGRSPGSLFGVDSVTMGFDRSYPVLRSDASYAPELAWPFEGIGSRLFGTRSLSGGGVIGQEWDNARHVVGSPGHHVLASSIDHSLIPMVLGADDLHHGDVVAFFHGDGVVLSASAMAWTGALHINEYDNDAERFVRNVVARFLDTSPLSQPIGTV